MAQKITTTANKMDRGHQDPASEAHCLDGGTQYAGPEDRGTGRELALTKRRRLLVLTNPAARNLLSKPNSCHCSPSELISNTNIWR